MPDLSSEGVRHIVGHILAGVGQVGNPLSRTCKRVHTWTHAKFDGEQVTIDHVAGLPETASSKGQTGFLARVGLFFFCNRSAHPDDNMASTSISATDHLPSEAKGSVSDSLNSNEPYYAAERSPADALESDTALDDQGTCIPQAHVNSVQDDDEYAYEMRWRGHSGRALGLISQVTPSPPTVA